MYDGTMHFHLYINHDLQKISVWHHVGHPDKAPPNEPYTEWLRDYPYGDKGELEARRWARQRNEFHAEDIKKEAKMPESRVLISVLGKERGIDE